MPRSASPLPPAPRLRLRHRGGPSAAALPVVERGKHRVRATCDDRNTSSAAQLATGVAGMIVALRRRHPYDVFWMHGQAETVARDAILRGPRCQRRFRTCSPSRHDGAGGPAAAQPGRRSGSGRPGRAPSARVPRRTAGAAAPAPISWDAVESPLAAAGIGLAGAMAALGSRAARWDGAVRSPTPVGAGRAGAFAKGRCTAACPTSR